VPIAFTRTKLVNAHSRVAQVEPCVRRNRHDEITCPFFHVNETKARRRDPSTYVSVPCPDFTSGTVKSRRPACPRGERCGFAHNAWEYWLHPTRYRTEMCKLGLACNRQMCFFAHDESELRVCTVGGAAIAINDRERITNGAIACVRAASAQLFGAPCTFYGSAAEIPSEAYDGPVVMWMLGTNGVALMM
jgi:hypothetical protein